MSATLDTLHLLRNSLVAAKNSVADSNDSGLQFHARGMRAGLQCAIDAVDREIDIAMARVAYQAVHLQKRPQPVKEPISTFRIEVSPEDLEQREIDIAAGRIPF